LASEGPASHGSLYRSPQQWDKVLVDERSWTAALSVSNRNGAGAVVQPIARFTSERDILFCSMQVIRGWDQGCMTMRKGEVATLVCTPENAYGAGGFPAWGIPPHATLTFEIEILEIN
jgi:hypothetical protein